MTTNKNTRNRFILVGSAIALCCLPQFARAQGSMGEGLAVTGQTIQDNLILNNISPINGITGGAGGNNGGIGLRVSSGKISGFTLTNSGLGSIMGGNGIPSGGSGGDGARFSSGIDFMGDGTISGLTINSGSGMIAGGMGAAPNGMGGSGGAGGNGLFLNASTTINMVTINNLVSIKGGMGGSGMDGGEGGTGGRGGHGILMVANGDITFATIDNSSLILGGAGAMGRNGGGAGGYGIFMTSNSDPSFVTTTNTGYILGGAGGNGAATGRGGSGGHAIFFQADTVIDTVKLLNANNAVIKGGAGGIGIPDGGEGGNGLYLSAGGFRGFARRTAVNDVLKNVNVENKGTIAGGDGGKGAYGDGMTVGHSSGRGGDAGHGIRLEGSRIDGVTILNDVTGQILGGEGGYGTNGGRGGRGGDGIGIFASGGNTVLNLQLTNLGKIQAGEGGDTGGGFGRGGDGGDGIRVTDFGGAIDGFNIFNAAGATLNGGDGGDGDDDGGGGGHAISMFASEIKNGMIINNGTMTGGKGGNGGMDNGGSGGTGIDLEASSVTTLEKILIFNSETGIVRGGNAGTGSTGARANGGDAIYISGPASNNIRITNFGLLKGGDAFGAGTPGMGINTAGNLSGVVIDNWGTIMAGAGTNPIAINLIGSRNVLNLNGFSTVIGKINATNGPATADSNILNINFSGISPAERAKLQAALAAQGVVPGKDANFTFTVRGVTYVIDPMVINLQTKSYQLQGLTGNQQALGAILDSFTVNPTGDLLNMLNAVDLSGNVPLALDALSPQRYQVFTDIALSNANYTTLEIDHRLNNRRDGSEPIDTSRFRVGSSNIEHRLGLSGRKGARGPRVNSPAKETAEISQERKWGGFISGTAVFGDIGGRAGLGDAEFTTAGLLMGVDGKVNDSLVAGVLFGYSNTDSDLDSIGSQADVNTFTTGVYAGWNQGRYYVNGLAAYSHNDFDSRRAVVFPGFNRTATSSTSGNQFALNIDGGYDYIANEKLTFGPLVGLQYVHLDVDGFTEAGAGAANLAVGGQDVDSLRSRLGVRANFRKALRNSMSFAADFRVAWQHEFLDDSRAITGTFANSGLAPFAVQTARPGRDAALIGLGLNVTYREYLTFFLDYDAQLGGSSDVLQSIRGGVKAAF